MVEGNSEDGRFFIVNTEGALEDSYITFNGAHMPDGDVPREHINLLYKRDEIVHREIFKEIQDLFGIPPKVITDNDELKESIKDILFGEKLKLYKHLMDASKGAYLDGMSLIYFNYDNDKNLEKEPDRIDTIKQIGVVYRDDVSSFVIDNDLSSETFNEVIKWKLTVGTAQELVHSSRTMHILFDSVQGNPWGISKIAPEYDTHMKRRVITQSIVTAIHQNASGIRAFELPDKATERERKYLEKNIKKLQVRSDMIIPHGTDIHHPGPTIAEPRTILTHLMETCSSMPYQILTGTSAGAVTGSETNLWLYYKELDNVRRMIINEMLTDFLLFLQKKGGLPEGDFELKWQSVFEPAFDDRALAFVRIARGLQGLHDSEILDREETLELMPFDIL